MTLRRFYPLAIVLALLSIACSIAWSDSETISTDNDPRLEQKVSFDADGIAISRIITQLSESTSVTMNAGQDDKDWAVRDRKVIVHVVDMKLVDLMRQLASVLHFHWSRGNDAEKSTYRLWQDRNERNEEESLRAAVDSAQSKLAREKRENGLADMVNLGSLSNADAANLKANDPWRYVLATEPLGRDVADLMSNFPDARNAFVQGSVATFAVSELPPALQDTLKRIAQSYDSLIKSIGGAEDHSDLFAKFDKLQITINKHTQTASGDIVSQSLLGRITLGGLDIPLFDPASPVGKALGKAIISLKGGASKDQVGKQLEADMAAALKVSEAMAQPAPRDITSDPAMRNKVKLFDVATTPSLCVTLKALALQSKLNIISDYFPSLPPAMPGGESTLGEQLELIRKAYGSNWTKAGGVLLFRDNDWATKRAWAVPDVWIQYWIERGKLNNGLFLEDLAGIGNLRDEQIDHTIMSDFQLVRLGAGEAARNRQILRFYISLGDEQRKQLTEDKLNAASLNDTQWAALKTALATKGAAYAAVQKGSQSMQLGQLGTEIVEYKFTYYPGENDPAVLFKLSSGDVYKASDEIKLREKPKP